MCTIMCGTQKYRHFCICCLIYCTHIMSDDCELYVHSTHSVEEETPCTGCKPNAGLTYSHIQLHQGAIKHLQFIWHTVLWGKESRYSSWWELIQRHGKHANSTKKGPWIPWLGIKPMPFFVWGNSTNHSTTITPKLTMQKCYCANCIWNPGKVHVKFMKLHLIITELLSNEKIKCHLKRAARITIT